MRFYYIITQKKFFQGSAVLVVTTVLSYALGLLRDRQFAHLFGAGTALDAYNAAFIVPDLILNIFVAGALSAAFVPLYTSLTAKNENHDAQTLTNSVLNSSLGIVVAIGILAWFLAPLFAHLIVPGMDAEGQQQFINLMRILLASPIIFAISNTLGSILVSNERFFWYGLSAALYNLGIILGTLFLGPRIGIYGATVGALMGAVLHLTPRLITVWSYLRYRPRIIWDQHLRSFFKLMIPRMAGHPIEQLTFLGFTSIASMLGAGSIAIMNFARNFQSMPVSVIGATLALTIFPVLSRDFALNDHKGFRRKVNMTAGSILAVATLAGIILFFIRRPLIAILLGGGEFGEAQIAATAATLAVFIFSIPFESLSHLLSRSFYALHNSLTPTLVSIGALGVALGSGYFFSRTMGLPGIALGFTLGSLVKVTLLWVLLQREIRSRSL